jgi:hypothetical protein
VQHERGLLWERVHLRHRLLQRRRHVLVRFFVEPDVAVADLDEEDALALRVGEKGQPADGEGRWNSADHSPDSCRSGPCHTAQKAATIDAVVALIGGDVVGTGGTSVALFVEPVVVAVVVLAHGGRFWCDGGVSV